MKLAFFPGCLVDMFYPEVGIAAVNVLERLGCDDIDLPKEEICCGQGLVNSGYAKETAHVARYVIDAYSKTDYDYIVSLTGSCMNAIVNDYPPLLADDPVYLEKLEKLSKRMYEFTDFIVNVLGVTNVGAHLDATVTYHASCHMTRFLGLAEPPLQLLQAVDGITYLEMEHKERCCGFGGTFSVKQPEISGEMVKEKCRTVIATGADVLVGADLPCLMNIKGALSRMRTKGELDRDIEVLHIAQVLDMGVN